MKKGWFIVGIIFFLVPWLMTGCGVSEEVYNAVVAERDSALAQVTTLQSKLSGAQAQVESLQSDISKAQEQVKKLEGDLSDAEAEIKEIKTELTPVWTSLDRNLDLTLLFVKASCEGDKFLYGLSSESELNQYMATWMIKFGTSVNAARDPEISGLWQDFWSYSMELDEEKAALCLISMEERVIELVEDGIEEVSSIVAD